MKLIILAAGFFNKLHPLTLTRPGSLLEIGSKSLIDHTLEHILPVTDLTGLTVVTNGLYANQFQIWAQQSSVCKEFQIVPEIVSNGSMETSQSKGALYDLRLGLSCLDPGEDALLVGGDNLLMDRVDAFLEWSRNKQETVVLACESVNVDRVKDLSSLVLESDNRISYFEEKPLNPRSTTSASLVIYFPSKAKNWISEFLESGMNPDRPGRLIEWMIQNDKPVFGWHFEGAWFDVSNTHTLEEVERIYKQSN